MNQTIHQAQQFAHNIFHVAHMLANRQTEAVQVLTDLTTKSVQQLSQTVNTIMGIHSQTYQPLVTQMTAKAQTLAVVNHELAQQVGHCFSSMAQESQKLFVATNQDNDMLAQHFQATATSFVKVLGSVNSLPNDPSGRSYQQHLHELNTNAAHVASWTQGRILALLNFSDACRHSAKTMGDCVQGSLRQLSTIYSVTPVRSSQASSASSNGRKPL